MISRPLMLLLIVQYAVIALAATAERNWPRALYFMCAGGITVAVLWMSETTS